MFYPPIMRLKKIDLYLCFVNYLFNRLIYRLLKSIFIGYKMAVIGPALLRPAHYRRHRLRPFVQELIHEPYRYRRRYPDGLFLGP